MLRLHDNLKTTAEICFLLRSYIDCRNVSTSLHVKVTLKVKVIFRLFKKYMTSYYRSHAARFHSISDGLRLSFYLVWHDSVDAYNFSQLSTDFPAFPTATPVQCRDSNASTAQRQHCQRSAEQTAMPAQRRDSNKQRQRSAEQTATPALCRNNNASAAQRKDSNASTDSNASAVQHMWSLFFQPIFTKLTQQIPNKFTFCHFTNNYNWRYSTVQIFRSFCHFRRQKTIILTSKAVEHAQQHTIFVNKRTQPDIKYCIKSWKYKNVVILCGLISQR